MISSILRFKDTKAYNEYTINPSNEIIFENSPEKNSQHDESNLEVISSPSSLEGDLPETTKSILISSFKHKKFECSGSCSCENENENENISQRKSVSLGFASKGMKYILSATSAAVATLLAKSHFEKECEKKLSSYCQRESILSEVGECYTFEDWLEEDFNEVEFENGKAGRRYHCYGHCVNNKRKNGEHIPLESRKEIEGFECVLLRKDGQVYIKKSQLLVKTNKETIATKFRHTAKQRFKQEVLVPFCKVGSRVKYTWKGFIKKGGKAYNHEMTKFRYACSANSPKDFSNVKCKQVDPKPTAVNSKYWDKVWWERKEELFDRKN